MHIHIPAECIAYSLPFILQKRCVVGLILVNTAVAVDTYQSSSAEKTTHVTVLKNLWVTIVK